MADAPTDPGGDVVHLVEAWIHLRDHDFDLREGVGNPVQTLGCGDERDKHNTLLRHSVIQQHAHGHHGSGACGNRGVHEQHS